jgi:hypothetical protein
MPILPNTPLDGPTGTGSVVNQVLNSVGTSLLGSVGLNPASQRKNVADMFKYSNTSAGPSPVTIFPNANTDWRVRVNLAPGSDYFYNDPKNILLSPLVNESGNGSSSSIGGILNNLLGLRGTSGATRVGVVFPYTPAITVTHKAIYSAQKLVHNNYTNHIYENSEVEAITITTDFTVQSVTEGQYLLATIYFFRSLTKMFFGNDPNAGNPPPIVFLNGYGQYYLPNVPCVVTSFAHTMPAEADYMDIPEPSATNQGYNPQFRHPRLNSTRLPTTSSMTVILQPVYSRLSQSQGFSLNDLARGALINSRDSNPAATAFGKSQPAVYVKSKTSGGFL